MVSVVKIPPPPAVGPFEVEVAGMFLGQCHYFVVLRERRVCEWQERKVDNFHSVFQTLYADISSPTGLYWCRHPSSAGRTTLWGLRPNGHSK